MTMKLLSLFFLLTSASAGTIKPQNVLTPADLTDLLPASSPLQIRPIPLDDVPVKLFPPLNPPVNRFIQKGVGALEAVKTTKIVCHDGSGRRPVPVNRADYEIAKKLFNLHCLYYPIPPLASVVVAYGNAVVYACNRKKDWQRCSLKEYETTVKEANGGRSLDWKCGKDSRGKGDPLFPGHVELKGGKWYGRDLLGAPVCE